MPPPATLSSEAKGEALAVAAATQTGVRDAQRWRAVLDRNADADFLYGVRSTGIYCRPACPSRRPKRGLVEFFRDRADAESAGFRACKRCRPDGGAPSDLERVRRACRQIAADPEGTMPLAALAATAGCSPRALQRLFRRWLGISPSGYASACRLSRFKALVREGGGLSDAAYEAGYGSLSRVYEQAGPRLGMTPGAYRRGGAGTTLRYALGHAEGDGFLLAASERGICALYLGEDASVLVAELGREFPAATITRDDGGLAPWVALVEAHLCGEAPGIELPLDVRATAFQALVWQALQAIPRGETRTYGQIAAAIGRPSAARAVGLACARNPVSLAIPCHRAIGRDGSLTGYRWGLGRKQALLAAEREGAGREP